MTVRPLTEQEVRTWLEQFPHSYVVAPLCEDWLRLNRLVEAQQEALRRIERNAPDRYSREEARAALREQFANHEQKEQA